MKRTFILTLSLLLTAVLSLSAVAQTSGINTKNPPVVEHDLMKSEEARLKQLKKDYKCSSVSIETWNDGVTYIVAKNKNYYSLFTLDGVPLLTRDGVVQWYREISPFKTDLCTVFILYTGKEGSFRKEIASSLYGIVTEKGEYTGELFWVDDYAGEICVKTAVNKSSLKHWPNGCGLYSIRTGKIFNTRDYVPKFTVTPSMAEGVDSLTTDGDPMGFWHGPRNGTIVVTISNRSVFHTNFIRSGGKTITLPGCYTDLAPGFGVLTPYDNVQFSENPECNVATYIADHGSTLNSMSLVTSDGTLLLDSIAAVTATGIPGVFLYRKIIDDMVHTGLVNIKNHSEDIAPKFSDIYITAQNGQWTPYVRPTVLSKAEKYDPAKKYERKFAGTLERALEHVRTDSILRLAAKTDLDTVSETGLIAISLGVMRRYSTIARAQESTIRFYDRPGAATDENDRNRTMAMIESMNPKRFSFESSLMTRTLDHLRTYDETLADRLADRNDLLLGDLIFTRDSIMPAKRKAWIESCNMMIGQFEQFEQAQKELKQKKAAAKAARIKAWADAAKQWSDAYNAKQAALQAKKRSAARGGKSAGRAGQTAAAPSSGDTSDRKAFLRGEIIEWKNKLKKAEASYQQALSSGGDNWEKERVIESKRNTVNECLEMIRQYEAELNSL